MKDVVRGGKGQLEGQVAWIGSPLALDYPRLTGQINVDDRRRASSSRPTRARRGCSAC